MSKVLIVGLSLVLNTIALAEWKADNCKISESVDDQGYAVYYVIGTRGGQDAHYQVGLWSNIVVIPGGSYSHPNGARQAIESLVAMGRCSSNHIMTTEEKQRFRVALVLTMPHLKDSFVYSVDKRQDPLWIVEVNESPVSSPATNTRLFYDVETNKVSLKYPSGVSSTGQAGYSIFLP